MMRFLSFPLLFLLLSAPALAQESPSSAQSKDQSSVNYQKTQKFIPGEEVVTPTGKKVRVWSTEGPVPVSRAPEPFEDREKSVLPSTAIIDVEAARRERGDSFEVGGGDARK